jgi:NDP-sugar pyrophosphorylase family protein
LEKEGVLETRFPVRIGDAPESARLSLVPAAQPGEWTILDSQGGQSLGVLYHSPGSACEVELFWGKGGFMAVVLSPQGVIYFALPGSDVEVAGARLHLNRQPYAGPVSGTSPPDVCLDPGAETPPSGVSSRRISPPPLPKAPQVVTDQAMILGAGLATRFERISGNYTDYSKPAVPFLGDRSVIRCLADHLARHGYTRLLVNTCFKPESLKAGLARWAAESGADRKTGTGEGREIGYIDETEPSGTAGALRKLLMRSPHVSSMPGAATLKLDRPLLVVQGDAVTDADFSALMNAHVAHDALVTIGCQRVADSDVDKFGIIVTDRTEYARQDGLEADQSGCILGFQEKPPLAEARSRLGNTGFYIFSPRAFPLVREIYEDCLAEARAGAIHAGQPPPEEVPFDFATDIFPRLLEKTRTNPALGVFRAQQVDGYWSDIGNPCQYLNSVRDVYGGKVGVPGPEEPQRYYRDGVVYWEGAQEAADREGARLGGNVVVALRFVP